MIGNAIRMAKIATGEAEEEYEDDPGKDHAATELGLRGACGEDDGGGRRNEPRRRGKRWPSGAAAGLTDRLWSVEDIAELIEAAAPKPVPRGPYKKLTALRYA